LNARLVLYTIETECCPSLKREFKNHDTLAGNIKSEALAGCKTHFLRDNRIWECRRVHDLERKADELRSDVKIKLYSTVIITVGEHRSAGLGSDV
jgi:hypothetical protein